MALIVEYHVIADMYPVNTSAVVSTATEIKQGALVKLTASGVELATATDNGGVLGIAGDAFLFSAGQTTAVSAAVLIGAQSMSKYTSNRVSDFYNETAASGKITVYNGGGKFWISEDLAQSTTAIDTAAEVLGKTYKAAAGGEWELEASVTTSTVAMAVGALQAYQSGVPGVDVRGSMTLGNYFPVVLRI